MGSKDSEVMRERGKNHLTTYFVQYNASPCIIIVLYIHRSPGALLCSIYLATDELRLSLAVAGSGAYLAAAIYLALDR